jgi:hypothetical protein
MIKVIGSPNELKGGVLYRQFTVKDQAEAETVANGADGMLFSRKLLTLVFYLSKRKG